MTIIELLRRNKKLLSLHALQKSAGIKGGRVSQIVNENINASLKDEQVNDLKEVLTPLYKDLQDFFSNN